MCDGGEEDDGPLSPVLGACASSGGSRVEDARAQRRLRAVARVHAERTADMLQLQRARHDAQLAETRAAALRDELDAVRACGGDARGDDVQRVLDLAALLAAGVRRAAERGAGDGMG